MDYSLLGIFGAGLATFFTPCVLPLVPVYLSALAGADIRRPEDFPRGRLLVRASLFSVGFLLVFILLGLAASSLGAFLNDHRHWLKAIGGVLVLLFGLHFLGLVKFEFLTRTVRADDRKLQTRFGAINAVLMGVVFAAGWSPCAGPILGSVLAYTASAAASPVRGAAYLSIYGLGFAIPLLLVAAFAEIALRWLRRISAHLGRLERIIGLLLVIVGASLLAGSLHSPDTVQPTATAPIEQTPSMIIFTSNDCSVCQRAGPVMESITERCDGQKVRVRTVEITTPQGREEARRFRLVATPTFVFINHRGEEVARLVGEQTEQTLLQALSALRGEPCPGVGLLDPDLQTTTPDDNAACQSQDGGP